jgi:hypothetical protein
MLRIFECAPSIDDQGNVYYQNQSFLYITEALWYIFITILTVGYGDVTPLTNPGRALGLFTVLTGTMMTSTMIVTIQDRLGLYGVESNVNLKIIFRLLNL